MGQVVEMRHMMGTEGMRVRRVMAMARRPRRETPIVWSWLVGPSELALMSSCTSNVDCNGVVGVLVVSTSERGW